MKNSDADSVLNEQGKIYRFSDGQIDSLKEIFAAENIIETVSKKRRVGILGGTFDPVHNDHIALALSAFRQLGLNEVWLMPICGGDTLSRMETWDGFDTLINLCSFAAVARDEKDFADKAEYLRSKYGMTINIIYPENFSSTQIIKRRAEPSGLDPLSELYFYETDKSKIVPVEKLRIVESVTPESIAEAEENLRRVLTGEISRLKPLTVVARNDGKGTCCIFDGSSTYSALVKRGVKNVPVLEIPRPCQKNVTTLEELYGMNREAQDEFNALMKDLQKELGGELKVRPRLKGEARVREKAKNQLDGDYSRVIDVLAGTLIFESESEILNAVERLKARDDVVWIGDRWNKPMDGGYRDFSVNIRMSSGAIVELQLHHRGIIEAKEGESGEGLASYAPYSMGGKLFNTL